MAKSIIMTILPSLWIILFILLSGVIVKKIDFLKGVRSIVIGLVAVIPALLSILLINYILGSLFTGLPLLLLLSISALNEEFFKYLFISFSYKKEYNLLIGIMVAGGFALGETLYLTYGNLEMSYYRSILTMPLHMITSIFLSFFYKKRGSLFFIAALLIHITFNLLITR